MFHLSLSSVCIVLLCVIVDFIIYVSAISFLTVMFEHLYMYMYIRVKVVGKTFLYTCGDLSGCIVKFGCMILNTYNILSSSSSSYVCRIAGPVIVVIIIVVCM